MLMKVEKGTYCKPLQSI